MKILLLVGSADAESHSLSLGRAIEAKLNELGAETELINLVEYGLPLYDRGIERANEFDQKTKDLLQKSIEADAFVWVTPIYHNSYSAMLKNALDWHHTARFPGKVLGLASNGGSRSPQAVDQLMLVARSQGLVTIPTRVCTDESDYNDRLELSDEGIIERVDRFSHELVDFAKKHGDQNV